MLNMVQPVSLSSLSVGPLFPAGVTFLWSEPRAGSHNNSHLSVHLRVRTLDHTLAQHKIQTTAPQRLQARDLWRLELRRRAFVNSWYINIALFFSPAKGCAFFFTYPTCAGAAIPTSKHWCWRTPMRVRRVSTFCPTTTTTTRLSGKNKMFISCCDILRRSLKICWVQPIWFMI